MINHSMFSCNFRIKITLRRLLVLALLTVASLFNCCDDAKQQVQITEVQPAIGCQGSTLQIKGRGFSGTPGENIVKLDGRELEVLFASPEELSVQLPRDAVAGEISVQVGSFRASVPVNNIEPLKYFIKFKANGKSITFETCEPGYEIGTTCGLGQIPVPAAGIAKIRACVSDKITFAFMDTWAGSIMGFESDLPSAHFEYYDPVAEKQMSSLAASNQTDSKLQITAITRGMSNLNLYIAYDVTGIFQCNVAAEGVADVAITEGEFSVRFTVSPD